MNRTLSQIALILVILVILIIGFGGVGSSGHVFACGDKFLVVSRGTRFERPASRRSAAILVYATPSSRLSQALAHGAIDATLQKAGYRPTTVATEGELDSALALGGWDLIVADVANARTLTSRARSVGSPIVLPVVYDATSTALKQIKNEFQCVLKSPAKSQSFLEAVDEALALRSKTTN